VTPQLVEKWVKTWSSSIGDIEFLLVLAGSLTAEVEGISAAGATVASRKYTAVADADFLLTGPNVSRKWPLPPLQAGISPALISHVASELLRLSPRVLPVGLSETPSPPYFEIESPSLGPSDCLSTGKAMTLQRVEDLWAKGFAMGSTLRSPLLLAECVPGGTTTALAVLTGLGMPVGEVVSGSNRIPPMRLKKNLVSKGLALGEITSNSSPQKVLAAVGDPFQPLAAGLILGARKAGMPVLLGGGSQMVAVLGISLAALNPKQRAGFVKEISIGTTAWLAEEVIGRSSSQSSFCDLIQLLCDYFDVDLLGLSCGLRFHNSSKKVLRDYELGFIKEGVGAGALALLAQVHGISCQQLLEDCDSAVDQLINSA